MPFDNLAAPRPVISSTHRKSVHDLRNLFAVISAAKHLLERDPPPAQCKALFDALEKATLRGGKLTTDLLACGEGQRRTELVDVPHHLAQLRPMMEALAGPSSLSIEHIGKASVDVRLTEFEASILELVANASRAGATSIKVRSRCGQDGVWIVITDNGHGMSEAMLRPGPLQPGFGTRTRRWFVPGASVCRRLLGQLANSQPTRSRYLDRVGASGHQERRGRGRCDKRTRLHVQKEGLFPPRARGLIVSSRRDRQAIRVRPPAMNAARSAASGHQDPTSQ